MAMKIDGQTYPDIGLKWVKHKTLGPILHAVIRTKLMEENFLFLAAIAKGKSLQTIYWGFIDPDKAKYQLNISGSTRDKMVDAAKMGNFYDKKIWKTGIAEATYEVVHLLQSQIAEKDLMENAAFRAYHNSKMWYNRASYYRHWKTSKEIKQVNKFLGTTHDGAMHEEIMEAYAALKYNPKQSKGPLEKLAKSLGRKPTDVAKAMKKAGV